MSEISKKALSEAELLKEIYKKLAGDNPALDEKKAISKFGFLREIARLPLQQINHVFDFNGNFESLPMNGYPINLFEIYPQAKLLLSLNASMYGFESGGNPVLKLDTGPIADVKPIIDLHGAPSVKQILLYGLINSIEVINNVNLLTSLEDQGTLMAFRIVGHKMTKEAIDDLFNQLPATSKTVTINIAENPGSATCDPTIATAKGYIVITS